MNSMGRSVFSQYRTGSVLDVINKLDKEYYDILEALAKQAGEYSYKLREKDQQREAEIYTGLSGKLAEEVKHYVRMRKGRVLPYVLTLTEKDATGHDCTNCSGGCNVKHSAQLLEIEESHQHLRELLYRLNKVAPPIYTNTPFAELYQTLRNEMLIIDTTLTELFFLEESVLIPKIIEAQKKINARS